MELTLPDDSSTNKQETRKECYISIKIQPFFISEINAGKITHNLNYIIEIAFVENRKKIELTVANTFFISESMKISNYLLKVYLLQCTTNTLGMITS